MISIVPIDRVLILFRCETGDCPDKGISVDVSISDILQVGNPICECCDEEMECLGTAEVEVTVNDKLISPD